MSPSVQPAAQQQQQQVYNPQTQPQQQVYNPQAQTQQQVYNPQAQPQPQQFIDPNQQRAAPAVVETTAFPTLPTLFPVCGLKLSTK